MQSQQSDVLGLQHFIDHLAFPAVASSVGGTVRPSILAVSALMT